MGEQGQSPKRRRPHTRPRGLAPGQSGQGRGCGSRRDSLPGSGPDAASPSPGRAQGAPCPDSGPTVSGPHVPARLFFSGSLPLALALVSPCQSSHSAHPVVVITDRASVCDPCMVGREGQRCRGWSVDSAVRASSGRGAEPNGAQPFPSLSLSSSSSSSPPPQVSGCFLNPSPYTAAPSRGSWEHPSSAALFSTRCRSEHAQCESW